MHELWSTFWAMLLDQLLWPTSARKIWRKSLMMSQTWRWRPCNIFQLLMVKSKTDTKNVLRVLRVPFKNFSFNNKTETSAAYQLISTGVSWCVFHLETNWLLKFKVPLPQKKWTYFFFREQWTRESEFRQILCCYERLVSVLWGNLYNFMLAVANADSWQYQSSNSIVLFYSLCSDII